MISNRTSISLNNNEDQKKHLEEALLVDNQKLMDGLKNCSTMLSELRTSTLSPKNYYELYTVIFDSLRHLSLFLKETNLKNKQNPADLYELVQYAGNIIPRLYLMISVGSEFMSMPNAPTKEILMDMLEMCRGVQHPIRGLFLRHYLAQLVKDKLPLGTEDE